MDFTEFIKWEFVIYFAFEIKHVILPTDAHPLFPLVYQALQWYSKTRCSFDWSSGDKNKGGVCEIMLTVV